MNVEEANNALEWARRSLAECVRREEQIRLKVEDLYDEEVHKQELIENLEHIYNHEKAKIDRLEEMYYLRMRECRKLDCLRDEEDMNGEGIRMNDYMLSVFYERRHKKRLDIAQKKRDGRYKKVLDELRNYYHRLSHIDDDFKKIVLKGNYGPTLVRFLNSLTDGEVNISESSWIFKEDETNYGFWVTHARTTMKPVYADIRADEARIECKVSNYEKYWCWEKGEYERKIVNWLKPDDYNEGHKWDKNEFLYFKRWHKGLVKALRLTRDVKTEKGHRKRNIDVEENRMRKIWNEKIWCKINKVDDLGEYCIRMFDEPPEFRPELEEGEIDEMYESEYGIDVEEEYNTSTTGSTGGTSDADSSIPELVEISEDDELEYERNVNVEENMMHLWRINSGNMEDVEYDLISLENLASTFILQE